MRCLHKQGANPVFSKEEEKGGNLSLLYESQLRFSAYFRFVCELWVRDTA